MKQRILAATLGAIAALIMGLYVRSTFGVPPCTKDCSANDGLCQKTDYNSIPGCTITGKCGEKVHFSRLPHHHDLASGTHGIVDVDVYCADVSLGIPDVLPAKACSVGKSCVPNQNFTCTRCTVGAEKQQDVKNCVWDDEGCGS